MAQDPEGHKLLELTRTLLPVGELDVKAHKPVLTSTNNGFALLDETEAIRVMEGGSGHYIGMMSGPVTAPGGVAFRPGRSSSSIPRADVMAHELGHNMSLRHAPCSGTVTTLDPSFPQPDGSIGAWGYDFRDGGWLVPPSTKDLMSYCDPPYWISDYHFTNALRFRLFDEGPPPAIATKSLLLWGGISADSVPFLEPAFVVAAPAALPSSTGEYKITGRTGGGDELFWLSFDMPEVADGDGRSSFAFALPVQPGWADQLASITLSGPGGSVTLDKKTDRPVTILRNPRTREIRGILRDRSDAVLTRGKAVSALSLDPGLERLTSRGLPDPEDWRR